MKEEINTILLKHLSVEHSIIKNKTEKIIDSIISKKTIRIDNEIDNIVGGENDAAYAGVIKVIATAASFIHTLLKIGIILNDLKKEKELSKEKEKVKKEKERLIELLGEEKVSEIEKDVNNNSGK